MQVTAMRTFRYVYRDPKLRYNEFNFLNRVGEPYDVVTESPKWFYSIMARTADPALVGCEEFCLSDFNYWMNIVAARHVTNPRYPYDLWSTMLWIFSEFEDGNEEKAPVVWYDPMKLQIRVGNNYKKALRKSIYEFVSMGESAAVNWMNQGFRVSHNVSCYQTNEDEIRNFYGY